MNLARLKHNSIAAVLLHDKRYASNTHWKPPTKMIKQLDQQILPGHTPHCLLQIVEEIPLACLLQHDIQWDQQESQWELEDRFMRIDQKPDGSKGLIAW